MTTTTNRMPATRSRLIALSLSSTMAIMAGAACSLIAVPILLRGYGNAAAASATIFVGSLAAVASVLLLARFDVDLEPDRLRSPLAAGIRAAGAIVLFGAIANVLVIDPHVGRTDIIMVVLGLGVIVSATPIAAWLSSNGRLAIFASKMIASSPARQNESKAVDRAAIVVGLCALTAGLLIVMPDGPFGHDESIYALKARAWATGTPDTGWEIYRAPGLSILGLAIIRFTSSEVAFRLIAIALAVGSISTMWLTGRWMYGRSAAWLGVLVFAGTDSLLRRATEFLTDVGAAGLLLATMLIMWFHFERRPGGWWLLAAAPLAAAAYYLRYGSAVGLAIIALVSAGIWYRRLAETWLQLVATAAAFVCLLLPHLAWSFTQTGSLLGVFESARTSVGGGGGGLVDYARWLPYRLAGPIGASVVAFSVLYLVWTVIDARHRDSPSRAEARTVVFTMATAILLTLALGAFTHAEPRFVYLPLMLTLLTGARALTRVWALLMVRPQRIVCGVAVATLVLGFGIGIRSMSSGMEGITDRRTVIVDASNIVRADAQDGECDVRTSYTPQVTWYAVCSSFDFRSVPPTGRPAYLLLFENGKRQPVGDRLESEVAATEGVPLATVEDPFESIGDATVYRYP